MTGMRRKGVEERGTLAWCSCCTRVRHRACKHISQRIREHIVMRKLIMVAMLATVALWGLSSAAGAATIEVTNLGEEALNIETQGRITFRAPGVEIVCDKTMKGHLEPRATGTLTLLGNTAGVIGEITLPARCRGGNAIALADLAGNEVRLSWLKAPREREANVEVRLAGNNANFRVDVIGERCLYRAELVSTILRPDERGLYRERLELRLLREGVGGTIVRVSGGGLCPRIEQVEMRGSLTVTRPAVGVGVILR